MSTSTIKEKIEAGDLDGWDDPRAPTLASLQRRGIRGEAIVDAMVELGTSTSNVDLAMSTIYANNRDLVDDETDRCFLVRDGERFAVAGGPDLAEPPVHPDHEDRGTREIPVDDAILLESADVPAEGDRVWLKGYGPVRRTSEGLEYTDDDIEVVREGGVEVVHWVPADESQPVTMRTMDGDVEGRAEPGITDYDADELLQFVRVGFVRVDAHDEGETVTYYAHP